MRTDISTTTAVFVALLSWASVARGDTPASPPTKTQPIVVGKDSRLWVEGDSTLHKFRLEAKELQISVESPEAASGQKLDEIAAAGGIKSLDVRVAVRGLSSGENGLDDNMRSALKADRNHEIRFQMDSYQSSPGADAAHLSLKLRGRLLIAGVEKPIEVDAAAARDGSALHVTGAKQLLLTDYGVTPPTFMLGAMSCRDAVSIHFDLRLEFTP